jgi:periplasmic protein CpxP/Spy
VLRLYLYSIKAIEQSAQITVALRGGRIAPEAIAAVEFTPQQRTQFQQIMMRSQQQMEAVLTPDQRAVVKRERLTIQNILTR